MSEHPIQGLMHTAMDSLKDMVDVNTVVGEAIETKSGAVIVPVSRVSFGFAAGGSQWPGAQGADQPFGGGSGAGVSVQPVAFLVVSDKHVRLLPVGDRGTVERLLDMAPEVIDRLQGLFGSDGSRNGTGGRSLTGARAGRDGAGAAGPLSEPAEAYASPPRADSPYDD